MSDARIELASSFIMRSVHGDVPHPVSPEQLFPGVAVHLRTPTPVFVERASSARSLGYLFSGEPFVVLGVDTSTSNTHVWLFIMNVKWLGYVQYQRGISAVAVLSDQRHLNNT